METRVNIFEKGANGLKSLFGLGAYLKKSSISDSLKELINFRISQVNGCAYCLDMHAKDARAFGETEQRIYGLSAWRETPYYTQHERAALAWAEAVNAYAVSEEAFAAARAALTEEELIDIVFCVAAISTWNRLNLAFLPLKPGSYTVGQFG